MLNKLEREVLKLKQIDGRGVSCPQPVLMTKKALEDDRNGVEVIVDNTTAKMNVERYLKNLGYKVQISNDNENFILKATK